MKQKTNIFVWLFLSLVFLRALGNMKAYAAEEIKTESIPIRVNHILWLAIMWNTTKNLPLLRAIAQDAAAPARLPSTSETAGTTSPATNMVKPAERAEARATQTNTEIKTLANSFCQGLFFLLLVIFAKKW